MAPRNRPHPYRKLILPKDAPFELRPSPGKGWGAFATKDIKVNTEILNEKPLFRTKLHPSEMSEAALASGPFASVSKDVLEQMKLLRVKSDRNKTFKSYRDLYAAHTFTVTEDGTTEGGYMHGFHIIAARFNHSCTPNMIPPDMMESNYTGTKGVRFVAARSISTDTELTYSYGEYYECLTRAERHLDLDLACVCDVCAASPQERYLSDLRRRLVRVLYYLIFGFDMVELHDKVGNLLENNLVEQDVMVDIKDCVPDAQLRKDAEEFKIPITTKLVHCGLALALMQAEGVLNQLLYWRFAWVMKEIRFHLCNDNAVVFDDVETHPKGWAGGFLEMIELLGRADPGNETCLAALEGRLKDYRGD